jgi:hypothetical protein
MSFKRTPGDLGKKIRDYRVSYLISVAPSNGEYYEVNFQRHPDFGWEVYVQPPEDNAIEFFFNTEADPTADDAYEYLFRYAIPVFKKGETV